MASIISLKSKAFTLAEAVMASFVFLLALGLVAQIIITLTKTAYQVNELNASLENLRLGLEKIWREVKYGSDFNFTADKIAFADRNCLATEIFFQADNLFLQKENQLAEIFDPTLVKVRNWQINFDQPAGGIFYFENAPKVIILSYDLLLKSKVGSVELKMEQAIAPLNSVFPKSPCQD